MTTDNEFEKLNVYPLNDIQTHRFDEHCMCNPVCEANDGVLIITHNSFDGREFKELNHD